MRKSGKRFGPTIMKDSDLGVMPDMTLGQPKRPGKQKWSPEMSEELSALEDPEEVEQVAVEHKPFLDKIEQVWRQHQEQSLPLHYLSGQLINEKLAEMAEDQQRGRALLTGIAVRLGVSLSDLSRERAFATRFATFEAFTTAHPAIKSWSAVKRLLAQLSKAEKPNNPGNERTRKSTEKQRQALIENYKELRQEIGDFKGDFSIPQIAEVGLISEEITMDMETAAAPLKRLKKVSAG